MKIKALIERVHSKWDASVTADQTIQTSLQMLFLLTNMRPTTKISELRVEGKYSYLGSRCSMAHDRIVAHQASNWNRIAEPVLGAGVNISEESVNRIALECGWQSTWMTEEVTTYARSKAAARRQSADGSQGRLSFTPRPAAAAPTAPPSQNTMPDSVIADPAPVAPMGPPSVVSDTLPMDNNSQARTGEQGRVPIQQPPFSPGAAPRSDPNQAADDGSQAAGREQGRVPRVVQEGRMPVDRNAHAVHGSVAEQAEISPNQEEAAVASAPEPDELPVPMELDTSGDSEPTAGAHIIVAATSKAKAKPRAKGKSKAKAKAMATALSTESQDEIDMEDQVEGQAEDQTEANDVIHGLAEEQDVANELERPPNRWNQDICVICHGEMNPDHQAGLFHLSLFNEPLIIATVHSTYYVLCLFICFHGMQVEALQCGHLFHSECINRYCDSTGRDKATACPLKCGSSRSRRFFFPGSGGREAARGSNDPVPVEDDADVNDVNQEIEAQIVDDITHRDRVEAIDPVVD